MNEAIYIGCAHSEVHLWRVALNIGTNNLGLLSSVLSDDEQTRASQFRTDELQKRWIISHAALRSILSFYVGVPAKKLEFTMDLNRKPRLIGPGSLMFFNLSHTEHVAFVAVSANGEVGVDAEAVRPGIAYETLSQRYFTPSEADSICSEAPQYRPTAFFACWTRKEAYLKSLGVGLKTALSSFRVSVCPSESVQLLWVKGAPYEPQHWHLKDFSEPGVAVALAARRSYEVQRFDFNAASRVL